MDRPMSRNLLYPALGALLIAVGALGYWAYDRQNRSGVDITVGGRGISVETR
jgi:hypothetical protein